MEEVVGFVLKITNMRIYLDVCCLNRPFDDQGQDRVRMETEAVKTVLLNIGIGHWTGVRSEVMDFEIGQMPDPGRQCEVAEMVGRYYPKG